MASREDILKRMNALEKYFERQMMRNEQFSVEYETAKSINWLTENLPLNSEKLISTFNQVVSKNHFNGSGWLDYKMHLKALFASYGMEVRFTEDGSIKKYSV